MPTEGEPLPNPGFDPILFWETHKTQIILFGALLVVAIIGWVVFELSIQRKRAAAQEAYGKASTTEELRKVATEYSDLTVGANAELRVAGALRDEGKHDEAIAALRSFIDKHPDHPLLASAWISLGVTQEAQGNTDEALETYKQIPTKFNDSYAAPMAMMSQANILRAQGKGSEAITIYETVLARYQDSIFAQQATQEMQTLRK